MKRSRPCSWAALAAWLCHLILAGCEEAAPALNQTAMQSNLTGLNQTEPHSNSTAPPSPPAAGEKSHSIGQAVREHRRCESALSASADIKFNSGTPVKWHAPPVHGQLWRLTALHFFMLAI